MRYFHRLKLSIHARLRRDLPLMILGALLPLSACAAQKPTEPTRETPTTTTTAETAPFSITFDREGRPMVLDQQGILMKPTVIDWPLKATAVKSMHTMSVIHVEGSDFYIIALNGVAYRIDRLH